MWHVYAICAVVGGTLLVCQFLLTLVGLGGDHVDLHADHSDVAGHHGGLGSAGWYLGLLSLRSVIAGLAFFGLAGLSTAGWTPVQSLAVSAGSGVVAVVLVGLMMRTLYSLNADGTVRIDGAVGRPGTVYLSIPGKGAGLGKVTLTLQDRTVEYQAVTFQGELPTGTKVVVTNVVGPDTVEVAAAPECGRMVHA
jgi:hypothetical protein